MANEGIASLYTNQRNSADRLRTDASVIFLIIFMLLCSFSLFACEKHEVAYTMLNVCSDTQQADAHVMKFSNGQVYVIDVGMPGSTGGERLIAYLKKENIKKIDKLFLSHAHIDHYGGVADLLESTINIREVFLNIPDKEVCDSEKPWGCDYQHYLSVINAFERKGISVKPVSNGDFFQAAPSAALQVLFAHNGIDPPVGRTDINDTSYIMKLSVGNQAILFAGDLNEILGDFLIKELGDRLRANILKVPHHGTEAVAKNAFFDLVSPEAALIPAPAGLWQNERSQRIRQYFQDKNTAVYVSGILGDVSVLLWKDRYQIITNKQ